MCAMFVQRFERGVGALQIYIVTVMMMITIIIVVVVIVVINIIVVVVIIIIIIIIIIVVVVVVIIIIIVVVVVIIVTAAVVIIIIILVVVVITVVITRWFSDSQAPSLCVQVCFVVTWLVFASYYFLLCFLHGDLDPQLMGDNSTWTPCVENVNSFTEAYLFSIETMSTIGRETLWNETIHNVFHVLCLDAWALSWLALVLCFTD